MESTHAVPHDTRIAPSAGEERLDRLSINTIRTLAMDALQQANSGHPGTAMAIAPVVHRVWHRLLRFDPEDPIWPNRDRFVPPAVGARVSVEQGSTLGRDRCVGPEGRRIGMHTFGASAPLKELQRKFGFTPEAVVSATLEILGRRAEA